MKAIDLRFRIIAMLLAGAVLAPAFAPAAQAAQGARDRVGSEQWPRWRGPRGDGISHDPIADKWPEDGPKKVWEQPVGIGYSTPIALDGKIYLFATASDGSETLSSFDAGSGAPIWSQGYPMHDKIDYAGARATPFIDGDSIYTYGAGGDLVCWALADGKLAWRLNVIKETGAKLLGGGPDNWGESSSPLVAGDLIYVQGGKDGPVAVAVDKKTGKVAWKSEAIGEGGYAACVLGDVKDAGPQLFVFGGEALYGMDPASGKTLWSEPWKNPYVNGATPIFDGTHLFVTSGYLQGCLMVEVSKTGAKKLWTNKNVQSRFQAPILDGQFLYSNSDDKRGTLKCMSWPDGKIKWEVKEPELKLGFGGSILRDGDKLITLSQDGVLSLLKATPETYEKISQVKLFTPTMANSKDNPDIWSSPIIYRGKLYAKGEDKLVCLDVSK